MDANRMANVFSHNVQRMRLEAGMTQQALAERCSKYKKQIPKIEDGTAAIHLSMIFVLAQALDVDPATLLKDPPPAAQPEY